MKQKKDWSHATYTARTQTAQIFL